MEKETINQKIKRLDEVVDWFYGENFDLAKATDKYAEAAKLAKEIEKDLNSLKNEISVIQKDFTKN